MREAEDAREKEEYEHLLKKQANHSKMTKKHLSQAVGQSPLIRSSFLV